MGHGGRPNPRLAYPNRDLREALAKACEPQLILAMLDKRDAVDDSLGDGLRRLSNIERLLVLCSGGDLVVDGEYFDLTGKFSVSKRLPGAGSALGGQTKTELDRDLP